MEQLKLFIGEYLKSFRIKNQLSLEDVSRKTDISKPMLSQIERGQSVPTINTLWKIATGLKIPLSVFFKTAENDRLPIDIYDAEPLKAENEHMRAYAVLPYDPIRNLEVFLIEFDPGCVHESQKHLNEVEEQIFVIQGKINLTIGTQQVVLRKNQMIRFQANVTHAYHNAYDERCIVQNIIFYPDEI